MSDSQLPDHWITLDIGDVADVVAGGTPKAGNPDNFARPGTGIPWLTPADLSNYSEKYIGQGRRDLSQIGYSSSSAKLMPAGSLLFSSRAPIGYVAIAQNEVSTNQGFKSFVFPFGVDSDYAYYYLKSIRNLAESLGTGTTFKEISGSIAKKLPFVLPPLTEQKVVAGRLDAILGQVAYSKSCLEQIPEILKRFRQSVLSAAMSGKLTDSWRVSHKVTKVASDIDSIKKSRDLVVIGNNSVPKEHLKSEEYAIPSTWEWVSLDLLTKQIVDGTHYTPKYVESGVPFVSVKDIKDGVIDFSDTKFITDEEHAELSKRCHVQKGDLLVTKSGTIGRTAIVDTDAEFSLFVSVALLKPASDRVNMKFINLALQKWVNEIDVSSRIVGSAIKNLHLRDMRVLAIPFAPLDEQTEIVHRVEKLFSFADYLEQKAQIALERVNGITQSVLAKAFSGELTTDWRINNPELINGDNGAEAILEKINAKRNAIKIKNKSKKKGTKKIAGKTMSKKIISIVEALSAAGEPLSGQQLLSAAGYPSDSSIDKLENFFLDIRSSLEKQDIIKQKRDSDGQDWFTLKDKTKG
ncbi:restriction endonuclease subunit S [Vibrio parahaemolyticus]|uniref:restriction endonuclease subunit S n=1 Tax=Vibrio parahaemolyticus TaxID=670 RepID=UPI00112466B9|nr:restriction endonuclease subunit S [Vibrio parahaemolyticus]MCZ5868533.1 restriction endonuclease subunit S [Vibrio parahaemolyticus]MCZ5899576.1 restriction endonuclease subunit S [Vibrio parahaemolyticus]MCZ6021903.1 restriction endonuclease subunit S [Vibrio parahaemolyticus]MCZ6307666.1 restriction endonuclease subunit S [Vibrio parahaemolyticus]TOG24224.1 restriction endonuclease subunit S [Vibrio parahaemolyticus]